MKLLFITVLLLTTMLQAEPKKKSIHALYIPLADHYGALVAYERYRDKMKYADFKITQMKNWDLLRAYFQSGKVDMAFVMSPLAMDMFNQKPDFRWIGLMHRDGNALAINDLIKTKINLAAKRIDRKPNHEVADALKELYIENKSPTKIGMPHLLSTHSVILYRYLKEYGTSIAFSTKEKAEVLGISVSPPKAPQFIKINSARATPAAFEQSLPWADVVETEKFGYVAWYSKDVMPFKYGHVECITLATDKAIDEKRRAVNEVNYFIHKAGKDIEKARAEGGEALEEIVKIVRKHIKAHTREAIIASLDIELNVINYKHLNVDKEGLKQIMDYAFEGSIIKNKIDISSFADESFSQTVGN
ncbi:MAG: nitrate ABC transporter substrate-binding protein [Sulfurimonas sp.]|nr:MAG: nitrate ABC transporter substrate-binding protein [Sulfurimonas sp.]